MKRTREEIEKGLNNVKSELGKSSSLGTGEIAGTVVGAQLLTVELLLDIRETLEELKEEIRALKPSL